MDFGEIIQKLKDQEAVDLRLVAVIPVLLIIGIGVFFFVNREGGISGGRDAPGLVDQTYICHFDQAERVVSGEELWELEPEGEAMISRGGAIPTRVRCPECNRMSCFLPDLETGEPIEVDESWDLSENAQPEASGRGRSGGGRTGR